MAGEYAFNFPFSTICPSSTIFNVPFQKKKSSVFCQCWGKKWPSWAGWGMASQSLTSLMSCFQPHFHAHFQMYLVLPILEPFRIISCFFSMLIRIKILDFLYHSSLFLRFPASKILLLIFPFLSPCPCGFMKFKKFCQYHFNGIQEAAKVDECV